MIVPVVMNPPLEWINRQVTEAELQRQVLQLAHTFGWESFHPRFSWRSRKGYTDLTLWNPEARMFPVQIPCVIWVELKTETGKVTPEQAATHLSMRKAGLTVYVWRPSDWPEILNVLSFGRARTT
jgi:hypothetical protein